MVIIVQIITLIQQQSFKWVGTSTFLEIIKMKVAKINIRLSLGRILQDQVEWKVQAVINKIV